MKKYASFLITLTLLISGCTFNSNGSAQPEINDRMKTELTQSRDQHFDLEGSVNSETLGTLIRIPSGNFQRDANPENISIVDEFLIAPFEVTRSQFIEITGLTDPSLPAYSHGLNDPVQSVYWYHTLVFCNRLSIREGLSPAYMINGSSNPDDWGRVPSYNNAAWNQVAVNWDANGYRLPTEMEWMWAAMGADLEAPGEVNRSGYAKRFSGDDGTNQIDDYAWYGEGRGGISRPVGSKLSNEFGVYDMTGNVWEWVWDRLGTYPQGTLDNYKGPDQGSERVLRGGSWLNPVERQTLVFRYHHTSDYKWHNMGFRVVRNK